MLDVTGIDNTTHVRDIVSVNVSLFHEINMSINKDDYFKFGNNSQSNLEILNDDIDTHE